MDGRLSSTKLTLKPINEHRRMRHTQKENNHRLLCDLSGRDMVKVGDDQSKEI